MMVRPPRNAQGFRWFVLLALAIASGALAMSGPPAHADEDYASLETRIAEATNAERAQNGLPALRYDSSLACASQGHSQEMVALGFFSHTSPTEGRRTLRDRLTLAGVRYSTAGENIAYYDGYGLEQVAQRVVSDWMDSPGHRANILCRDFKRIGIGVAAGGRKTYITQDFATLTSESRTQTRHRFRIPILFP